MQAEVSGGASKCGGLIVRIPVIALYSSAKRANWG
jgi:hypothetical protein